MFVTMLSSGLLDRGGTDSVGRLMPFDEYKLLVAELEARPELEDALAKANPQDRWATEALPSLGRWLRKGRPRGPAIRTIGAEFDYLDGVDRNEMAWSFSMILNALRRRAVKPTKQACILATARNEGIYFIEWLAHHRALGFESFFIYTNDNTDESDQLLETLSREGAINLVHNRSGPNIRPQYKAYTHALQFLPEILDYAWTAVIDLDEFIRINTSKFSSIIDYLNWSVFSKTDSISLSWKLVGPNKQMRWRDAPLNQRFPNINSEPNDHLKSIFKANRFLASQCHFPYAPGYESRVYSYSNGAQTVEGPLYKQHDYNYAWIDHFQLKSFEEHVVRRSRNTGDHALVADINDMNVDHISSASLVDLYLSDYDREDLVAPTSDDALDQKRRVEIEKLIALPGVSSALERCKSAFQAEVDQVKSILARNPRFQIPGTPENRLMAVLRSAP